MSSQVNPASQIHFHDNVILDCHESLGVSPITHGPALIERNLFYHPHVELNGAQVKLLGNDPRPGQERATIANVEIRDNLAFGNWLCWWDVTPVRNVFVHDNRFTVRAVNDPVWPPGVREQDNLVTVDPELPKNIATLDLLEQIQTIPSGNAFSRATAAHVGQAGSSIPLFLTSPS